MPANGRWKRHIAAAIVAPSIWGAGFAEARADRLPPEFAEQRECGTTLTPADARWAVTLSQSGMYELPPGLPESEPWIVPMTIHVVRDSQGNGGLPETRVEQALADANAAFVSVNIRFFRPGPTRYIDDDDFYYNIDTLAEINALRRTDRVPNTINVYFTANMPYCGISSFTFSPVQGIVMHNACTGTAGNPSTFPHEIGHYFDLLHTHETARGVECVARTNCDVAGDLLCDTPADPGLLIGGVYYVDRNCRYTGAFTSPCPGDPPYDPDTANYMSSSRPTCRTNFSAGQDARALATLLNLRPELAHRACVGDLDGDEDTDLADLGLLLADFGCTAPGPCPGDLDNDGDTDLADLGILLADFGCGSP